jgi:hypothetical protein
MQEIREHTPEDIVSLDAAARGIDADFARRMGLDAAASPVEQTPVRARRQRRRRAPAGTRSDRGSSAQSRVKPRAGAAGAS